MVTPNTKLMANIMQELNQMMKEFTEKMGIILDSLIILVIKMT